MRLVGFYLEIVCSHRCVNVHSSVYVSMSAWDFASGWCSLYGSDE